MKKNIIISLLAGLLILTSCEDFLDLAPIDEIGSNGFYKNTEEVEAGVISIYDGLQAVVMNEFALTEMRSDNTKTKNSEGDWAQFEDMNVSPTNATVSEYWSLNYNVVFRANVVLQNLDAVSDEAKRNQFEGEAKFARALAHFNLVRAFGDVPIIDKVIGPEDKDYFSRRPADDVYQFIIADLTDAASKLPGKDEIAFGRATKGAAYALLAKVYLTVKDYGKANDAINEVLKEGYALEANYNDVFYNEMNDEIIFAIQYIPDNTEDSEIFSYNFTWKGRASGLNYPTDDLLNSLEAGDLRQSTLFYWEPLAGSSGRFECGKFRASSSNEELGGNDWIVLRLADVYLMQAEAIMGAATATSDATAIEAVNKVRRRAGLPEIVGSLTKDQLLKERRIELAFENHRLYDLIRFGVADQVMEAFSNTTEASFEYNSNKLLLPVPQREINLYDGLTQNPGY
ncbi:RagB/SusD family nutrient uptake outer membrane protein [Tenuifilum thalassicum]|nr:RagB/SusD family nutrient uptake outer membrane protein [Tenuifilum thalassicum]